MSEEDGRAQDAERDEHDAGIRIRGEAPATRWREGEGAMPGVVPAELDSPPPGSLQGSPLGISATIGGAVPADETDAWAEAADRSAGESEKSSEKR